MGLLTCSSPFERRFPLSVLPLLLVMLCLSSHNSDHDYENTVSHDSHDSHDDVDEDHYQYGRSTQSRR